MNFFKTFPKKNRTHPVSITKNREINPDASQKWRYIVIAGVALTCLFLGAVSVGSEPLVNYLSGYIRNKLSERSIFITYNRLEPTWIGIDLDQADLQIPSMEIREHFDSVSINLNLTSLVTLQPKATVSISGLSGSINAILELPLFESTPPKLESVLNEVTANEINLKRSGTLSPIGLTSGLLSLKLKKSEISSSECLNSKTPCFSLNFSGNNIEKTVSSELSLPPPLRGLLNFQPFIGKKSITIPPFPKTDISASLNINEADTLIHSLSFTTDGISLKASAKLPAGLKGAQSIRWLAPVEASGSIRLNSSIATLISLFLRPPILSEKISPNTDTPFVVSGPLIKPSITLIR